MYKRHIYIYFYANTCCFAKRKSNIFAKSTFTNIQLNKSKQSTKRQTFTGTLMKSNILARCNY